MENKRFNETPIIISRTPFRLPLGGGSTDMPSYYKDHGGFIFAMAINMYMDILVKEPVSDDSIHMHYTQYEVEDTVASIRHTIGKEALNMLGVRNKTFISFSADTPAGTGLGSSGACSVGLLKALSLYQNKELSNLEAAEQSFVLTQNLRLPDGKQDPYACALGGFTVLEIERDGSVKVSHPSITQETQDKFFCNTLFFYTGIRRNSKSILAAQDEQKAIEAKHNTKRLGGEILEAFISGNLDDFGRMLDEHWNIKKAMFSGVTNMWLDEVYEAAKQGGALGGKIMGAGGGGYFMFYCPTESVRTAVRTALQPFGMREMFMALDIEGSRVKKLYI